MKKTTIIIIILCAFVFDCHCWEHKSLERIKFADFIKETIYNDILNKDISNKNNEIIVVQFDAKVITPEGYSIMIVCKYHKNNFTHSHHKHSYYDRIGNYLLLTDAYFFHPKYFKLMPDKKSIKLQIDDFSIPNNIYRRAYLITADNQLIFLTDKFNPDTLYDYYETNY